MTTVENVVESTINGVTVYPDRARVTAVGSVNVETGVQRLIIDELPLTLDVDSVRVSGQGTARVRLYSVDVQQRHYETTPAEQLRDLLLEIERLEDEGTALGDRQAALKAQMKHIDGLRDATDQYAKALAWGNMTVEGQAEIGRFLFDQDTTLRADLRELDTQQRALLRRLDQLRRQAKALQSQQPRRRYQAHVELEVLSAGTFEPEITYVVSRAGWKPLYDVRLTEGKGDAALQVAYLAQVTQNTGQDWRGVALRVSTARPALTQRLPELHPWYIDERKPVPQPLPKMVRSAMPQASPASLTMLESADSAPMQRAETVTADASDGGLATSFDVPGGTDIPSDGSPHKVTLQAFNLTPRIDYFAVPKHTDAVYRRAKVTNSSRTALMAGPTNLFVGDEFIGRIAIPFTPVDDEIELLLGVEDGIVVERELVRRAVDKRFLGDKRVLRFGYKIAVRNLLDHAADIVIEDQIPVSRHEQIKVKLEKCAPDSAEHSELNLLKWRFTLAAAAKQDIYFDYMIEHPRSIELAGHGD